MSKGLIIVIVLCAVGLALWLWRGRGGGAPSAFDELLQMCRGDAAQAQRLIDGEKRRAPEISDEEATRRAIRAWRRDLR